MRSLPDLVEETPAEGIPEGIPEGIADLADLVFLSTLGGAMMQVVDEDAGVDGGQKRTEVGRYHRLEVAGRTVTLLSN